MVTPSNNNNDYDFFGYIEQRQIFISKKTSGEVSVEIHSTATMS